MLNNACKHNNCTDLLLSSLSVRHSLSSRSGVREISFYSS